MTAMAARTNVSTSSTGKPPPRSELEIFSYRTVRVQPRRGLSARPGQRGGGQPLGPGDLDVGATLEVDGPRLVRPEVGDVAETVPVQQPRDLGRGEAADERLAQLRGQAGERGRDLRSGAGERGRRLVVREYEAGTGAAAGHG